MALFSLPVILYFSSRHLHNFFLGTESNAFSISINAMCAGLLYSHDFSIIILSAKIRSVVLLFFLNPYCSSLSCSSIISLVLFSNILSYTVFLQYGLLMIFLYIFCRLPFLLSLYILVLSISSPILLVSLLFPIPYSVVLVF